MTPGVFIFAFILYSIFVYIIKRVLYPFEKETAPLPITKWLCGYEYAIIVSPDYWWAFRFKSRIKSTISSHQKRDASKKYVIQNNKLNLIISIALAATCLTAFHSLGSSHLLSTLLSALAVIRFISRSYEIAYAFGCDVFQQHDSSTGLKKHERISLALYSYVEIFFYSAATYTVLPTITTALDAITLALNVGTLTNVGYAFSKPDTPFFVNILFVQVFSTLSLVVLSLAAYLSKNENA